MDKRQRQELKRKLKEKERERAWAVLGLDEGQLRDLHAYLEGRSVSRDCDHTLAVTLEWANLRAVPEDGLVRGLEALGGYCDCEVLDNVHPDAGF